VAFGTLSADWKQMKVNPKQDDDRRLKWQPEPEDILEVRKIAPKIPMGKDICQIKNGDKCCCICTHHFPATVCNCLEQWPPEMVIKPSPLNDRHGQIGWACTIFMPVEQGCCIEISRKEHGLCEGFRERP